jgi:hypothetical protein
LGGPLVHTGHAAERGEWLPTFPAGPNKGLFTAHETPKLRAEVDGRGFLNVWLKDGQRKFDRALRIDLLEVQATYQSSSVSLPIIATDQKKAIDRPAKIVINGETEGGAKFRLELVFAGDTIRYRIDNFIQPPAGDYHNRTLAAINVSMFAGKGLPPRTAPPVSSLRPGSPPGIALELKGDDKQRVKKTLGWNDPPPSGSTVWKFVAAGPWGARQVDFESRDLPLAVTGRYDQSVAQQGLGLVQGCTGGIGFELTIK